MTAPFPEIVENTVSPLSDLHGKSSGLF